MIKRRAEPAKMTKVKNVVTVKADVDRELPLKYLGISHHSPAFFLARKILYNVRALIV